MATKKTTKRTPKKKSLKGALDLLAASGIDLSSVGELQEKVEVEEAQREHPRHFQNLSKNRMMEAEGALFFMKMTPSRSVNKTCRRESCDNVFLTNYLSISYCSNECRRDDLKENFGIQWNEKLAEEQWGIYEPGLQLSGPVVNIMVKLLERMGFQVIRPQSNQESPDLLPEPVSVEADSPKNEVPEQAPSEKSSDPQLEHVKDQDDFSFLDDLSL